MTTTFSAQRFRRARVSGWLNSNVACVLSLIVRVSRRQFLWTCRAGGRRRFGSMQHFFPGLVYAFYIATLTHRIKYRAYHHLDRQTLLLRCCSRSRFLIPLRADSAGRDAARVRLRLGDCIPMLSSRVAARGRWRACVARSAFHPQTVALAAAPLRHTDARQLRFWHFLYGVRA